MRKVLFAIPGLTDPVSADTERKEGAVLRLLRKRSFDKVILLSLPGYRLNATLTEAAITQQFPKKTVRSQVLDWETLSYKTVFNGLKTALEVGTSECRTDDFLTFLLPSVAEDPILDCWLLSALALPHKVEVCSEETSTVDAWMQQTLRAEADAFEWHDSATDEGKSKTFLSSKQLDFLYRTWNQYASFCLKTENAEQQDAVSQAMYLYSQSNERPYREIDCADIPESVSTQFLWGYRAEVNGESVSRDGLLTKKDENISLLRWESFSESLKSNTVAFLSKSGRHFMALSNTEDAFSQIPTCALPNN